MREELVAEMLAVVVIILHRGSSHRPRLERAPERWATWRRYTPAGWNSHSQAGN